MYMQRYLSDTNNFYTAINVKSLIDVIKKRLIDKVMSHKYFW
jgi:hypothetical protein